MTYFSGDLFCETLDVGEWTDEDQGFGINVLDEFEYNSGSDGSAHENDFLLIEVEFFLDKVVDYFGFLFYFV